MGDRDGRHARCARGSILVGHERRWKEVSGQGREEDPDGDVPRHLEIHGRITEQQGAAFQWQGEPKELGDGAFTGATKIQRQSMPIIGTAHGMLLMLIVGKKDPKPNSNSGMLYSMDYGGKGIVAIGGLSLGGLDP